eukprot:c14881_g1_i1 orf=384-881(-)
MLSACRAAAAAGLRRSRYLGIDPRVGQWYRLGQKGRLSTSGEDADSHDDFKPKDKALDHVLSVHQQIEKDVKENPVVIYMKGVPESPQCGFSSMACQILQMHDVPLKSRNILADPDLRQGLKSFSNWPTFPQVFVKGEFVGGSDILKKMHESGELEKLLKDVPRC